MKKRRKTDTCLNCGYKLDPSFDYCPACGQENTDNQISFGSLVNEFLSNYFSLDSRFGRSIFPFFFKPGTLTKEFMDGKRVKYANPIRLYLVVSLIHFFVMNTYLDNNLTHDKLFDNDSDKNVNVLDSLAAAVETDSLLAEELKPLNINISKDSADKSDSWPMSQADFNTAFKMVEERYTVQEIEDSIHNESNGYMAQKINRQLIKLISSDQHTINMLIVKNIPMLMFFLLPIFALILKILFHKKLYINHLIHGLHIHSFTFIVLTIYWIIRFFSIELAETIDFYLFLICTIYVILSFRNTYQIKYRTAIFKVFLSGFIYIFTLSFGFVFEVLISFLIY